MPAVKLLIKFCGSSRSHAHQFSQHLMFATVPHIAQTLSLALLRLLHTDDPTTEKVIRISPVQMHTHTHTPFSMQSTYFSILFMLVCIFGDVFFSLQSLA